MYVNYEQIITGNNANFSRGLVTYEIKKQFCKNKHLFQHNKVPMESSDMRNRQGDSNERI